MNLQKLNPWNWFKHEDVVSGNASQVPVSHHNPQPPARGQEALPPLLRLHREIDRLFDDLFSGFGTPTRRSGDRSGGGPDWAGQDLFRPNVDVAGTDSHYEITVDVPGLTADQLSVEVRGDVLTIKGEKQESQEQKDRHFYRVERRYGTFQRTLALPEDADGDEIRATLDNGVLALTIPRRASPHTDVKRISIH